MFKLTTKSNAYKFNAQVNEDLIDGKQYQLQLQPKDLLSIELAAYLLNNVDCSGLICDEEMKISKCIFPCQSNTANHSGELIYAGGEAAIDESYVYSDRFRRFLAQALLDSVNVSIIMDYHQDEKTFQYVASEIKCDAPLKIVHIGDNEENLPGSAAGKDGYFVALIIGLQARSGKIFIAELCYTPRSVTLNEKELPSVDRFFDKNPWLQMNIQPATMILADMSSFESSLNNTLESAAKLALTPFCKMLVKNIELQS